MKCEIVFKELKKLKNQRKNQKEKNISASKIEIIKFLIVTFAAQLDSTAKFWFDLHFTHLYPLFTVLSQSIRITQPRRDSRRSTPGSTLFDAVARHPIHPMSDLGDAFLFLIVGLIWGSTNVFMKMGAERAEGGSPVDYVLHVALPFVVNQLGSVLFYRLLSSTPLSLVVPITNSITQVFTLIFSYIIGKVRGSSGWSYLQLRRLWGAPLTPSPSTRRKPSLHPSEPY